MKDTSGRVSGVSLVTFLQMVEQDKRSCTVTVNSEGDRGRLHFHEGVLVDADTGDASGTQAAYEIINWHDPDVLITYDVDPSRPRRIDRPLMAIILDVHKKLDEEARPGSVQLPVSAESRVEGLAPATVTQVEQEEVDMNTLPQLLGSFKDEVPEFVSTDIVNIDSGLSISGATVDPEFDASVASACSAEVVKANRRTLELLGLGAHSTEDILISTAKVYLLIRLLGPDYYHVLAVNRKGNLGLARAIMKKHQPRLQRAISELG